LSIFVPQTFPDCLSRNSTFTNASWLFVIFLFSVLMKTRTMMVEWVHLSAERYT
jgi:hypothetical protein